MARLSKQQIVGFWTKNQKAILVVASAVILTAVLLSVRASSSFLAYEGEGGLLKNGAVIKSDSNASGGSYVEFTSSTTSGNAPGCTGSEIQISPVKASRTRLTQQVLAQSSASRQVLTRIRLYIRSPDRYSLESADREVLDLPF
jgi:hypothetical protein